MSVRAFQPRSIDPPHFVAEDIEDLAELVGAFVGGEQCDGCGNHSYEITTRAGTYFAKCALDPDESPEFRHPDPCGAEYPIQIWDDEQVVF